MSLPDNVPDGPARPARSCPVGPADPRGVKSAGWGRAGPSGGAGPGPAALRPLLLPLCRPSPVGPASGRLVRGSAWARPGFPLPLPRPARSRPRSVPWSAETQGSEAVPPQGRHAGQHSEPCGRKALRAQGQSQPGGKRQVPRLGCEPWHTATAQGRAAAATRGGRLGRTAGGSTVTCAVTCTVTCAEHRKHEPWPRFVTWTSA
jgi:hypothetical protein